MIFYLHFVYWIFSGLGFICGFYLMIQILFGISDWVVLGQIELDDSMMQLKVKNDLKAAAQNCILHKIILKFSCMIHENLILIENDINLS